jgi:collagen type VII alpha
MSPTTRVTSQDVLDRTLQPIDMIESAAWNSAGAWSNVTNYEIGDVVRDLSATYRAIAANLNDEPPSANWEILADAPTGGATGATGSAGVGGATGATGATGTQGATGITGATGTAGVQGATGVTGGTGVAGTMGATGATGTAGVQGATGIQGATGSTGTTGATGVGSTGATGAAGAAATGLILYFENTSEGIITDYNLIEDTPAGGSEADESVSVAAADGEKLIRAFITPTGFPGIDELTPGLWAFDIWYYIDAVVGISNLVMRVYKRAVGGTETEIFNVTSDAISVTLVATEDTFNYVTGSAVALDPTDRIVVKVFAKTTSAIARTVHFVFDGNTHASHVASPITEGAIGATGATGVQGPTGATGTTGIQGATGVTGATGTAGTTGATGVQGATGVTGATGTAGSQGATGITGATGTAGPDGATGVQGATGVTGATGTGGAQGATGVTGATGAAGGQGATGVIGATGAAGTQGATGVTGATGVANMGLVLAVSRNNLGS